MKVDDIDDGKPKAWDFHNHPVNPCKHKGEIIKPDPPEPIWFDKKPYKCVQCGEQIHSTQIIDVDGSFQVKSYAEFGTGRKKQRRGKPETWSDYPRGKDCS